MESVNQGRQNMQSFTSKQTSFLSIIYFFKLNNTKNIKKNICTTSDIFNIITEAWWLKQYWRKATVQALFSHCISFEYPEENINDKLHNYFTI